MASESKLRSQAQASISTILCCQIAGLPSKSTTPRVWDPWCRAYLSVICKTFHCFYHFYHLLVYWSIFTILPVNLKPGKAHSSFHCSLKKTFRVTWSRYIDGSPFYCLLRPSFITCFVVVVIVVVAVVVVTFFAHLFHIFFFKNFSHTHTPQDLQQKHKCHKKPRLSISQFQLWVSRLSIF